MAGRTSTFRHALLIFALAGTALYSSLAQAAYTIQIGAFRNPSTSYTAVAAEVASVYVTERSNGVKALSVGSFSERAAASAALERLQAQYPGAFVATLSESAMLFDGTSAPVAVATSAAPPIDTDTRGETTSGEQALLNQLSDAERSRVVYLDGVLHVKNGAEFIPLSEYGSN